MKVGDKVIYTNSLGNKRACTIVTIGGHWIDNSYIQIRLHADIPLRWVCESRLTPIQETDLNDILF